MYARNYRGTMGKRIDTEKFIERSKKIHGDLYDYSKVNYKNSKTKVCIKCIKCGHEWLSLAANHFSGRGCKKCQYSKLPQNKPMSHDVFLNRSYKTHGDKFDFISKYKSFKSLITIKCKACGTVFEQRADSHLAGRGCRKCQYAILPQNQPLSVDDFENRCKKLHENKYQYCGDYKGSRYKINIFCKYHKENFLQGANAHLLKGQGCPKCNLSRGEKRVEAYLKCKKINFECEKNFYGCRFKKPLSFDFYLPDFNLCIEYDGELHYYPIAIFGGIKTLAETKLRDEIKNNFCKKESIKILRIPFFEFNRIEEILENELFS